jgi:hypothetical protein
MVHLAEQLAEAIMTAPALGPQLDQAGSVFGTELIADLPQAGQQVTAQVMR